MYPSLPSTQAGKDEDNPSSVKDRSQSQTSSTKRSFFVQGMAHSLATGLAHTSLFRYFSTAESMPVQKAVLYYKTTRCLQSSCRSGDNCFYYHSSEDRRRPPFFGDFLAYSSQLCPAAAACPNGDSCYCTHNKFEVAFHPEQYKTKRCVEDCKRVHCPYAHSVGELRKQEALAIYSVSAHGSFAGLPQPGYGLFGTVKNVPKKLPLDIHTFKSKPCPCLEPHSQKQCIYFHTASDRRRVPVFYSYERCGLSKHSHCPLEDACPKSHNAVEQLYHPEKYKKKMCHEYPNKVGECDYGEFCSFAHAESELKIELIHEYEMDQNLYMYYFKTESCPFNHEHNKSICVYWHNWQDFRRKVEVPYPQYSPTLCPNWDTNKFINKYTDGCPRGFKCQYSHGWKECLYHPYFYKTTPCQEMGKCHQGADCPYYHSEFDHRYPTTVLSSGPVLKKKQWSGEQSLAERTSEADTRFSEGLGHIQINPVPEAKIEKRSMSSLSLEGFGKQLSAKSSSPAKTEDQTPISATAEPSLSSSIPLKEFASLRVSPEKDSTPEQKGAEEEKHAPHPHASETKKDEPGSKSCPSSPSHPRRRYGKIAVFRELHLDDEEDNEGDRLRLRNFMDSIGLGELTDKLLSAGYVYYDMLVEPESKCKSAGITERRQVQRIVDRVHQILSMPIGSESPRTTVCNR